MAKQVLTLHDMIFEDHSECFRDKDKWLRHVNGKKACIKAADAIVCVSNFTLKRLKKHYPELLEGKTATVIRSGGPLIDHENFEFESSKRRFRKFQPYVVHVGSRHSHKNFPRLLEVMSDHAFQHYWLLSFGGGNWTPDELHLIEKLGLKTRCICVPYGSRSDLLAAYESASVVAIPSISEGFGLPLLEAMACGKVIVAANAGSLPEIGQDIPFYFDPFDTQGFSTALSKGLFSPNLDLRIKRGIKRAASFSWKHCADEYSGLYCEVLNRS
jgi:glycosyltransferase involved in cell wall biosynthesis